jgi:hypothetical protein
MRHLGYQWTPSRLSVSQIILADMTATCHLLAPTGHHNKVTRGCGLPVTGAVYHEHAEHKRDVRANIA